jgi:hypothetical protein
LAGRVKGLVCRPGSVKLGGLISTGTVVIVTRGMGAWGQHTESKVVHVPVSVAVLVLVLNLCHMMIVM